MVKCWFFSHDVLQLAEEKGERCPENPCMCSGYPPRSGISDARRTSSWEHLKSFCSSLKGRRKKKKKNHLEFWAGFPRAVLSISLELVGLRAAHHRGKCVRNTLHVFHKGAGCGCVQTTAKALHVLMSEAFGARAEPWCSAHREILTGSVHHRDVHSMLSPEIAECTS